MSLFSAALSNKTGGIFLGLRHFHLARDEDLLCRLDLVVQAVQQVAVEADRVEDNVLICVSRQVGGDRRRVNRLVLHIGATNSHLAYLALVGGAGKRRARSPRHLAHLALKCRHIQLKNFNYFHS